MELALAKEEKLLKSWEYSKITNKGETKTQTLTVTDQRIIHDVETPKKLERVEIDKKDISSVETIYGNLVKRRALRMMCISLALAVVGIILLLSENPTPGWICIGVGLVGAVYYLITYLKSLKNIVVYVVINKRTNEELAFSCYSSTLDPENPKKAKKRKKKKIRLKVQVNHEIARDLTDSIPTLLYL